jgi:YD repeat-containing protein
MKINLLSLLLIFVSISIVNAEEVQYSYDNLHRIISEQHSDGTIITYSYDAAGNRTTKEVIAPQSSTTTTVPATVINLASFTEEPKAGKVILRWSTESETDNAGFNILRAEAEDGDYIKINASLLAAKGSFTQGASYEFVDKDVKNVRTYYYKLEDIDLSGKSTMHGPVSATPRLIFGFRK